LDQPVYWSVLVGVAVVTAAARLVVGRPLLSRRAVPLTRTEFVVAVVSLVALVFHCAAMFFAPWTDALPGGEFLGEPIRRLGTVSHWTYWLPAGALLLAVRRLWWPAPVVLAVALAGVGITMFWPYSLVSHLAWLAGAGLTWVFIAGALMGGGSAARPASRPAPARIG
jgi:hypothetical protein